jgi:hypothetical protein
MNFLDQNSMLKRSLKILALVFLVYAGIVASFESLLGYFQPANQSTLVISTTNANGEVNDRVLARLESNAQLYVAANHWPRAWYRQALANPGVQITMDGVTQDYVAISVAGEEHQRVNTENNLGTMFKILTGFPPRYFIRLEPRE